MNDIRKMYGTNKKSESEGKWYMLSESMGFCLKRFGGANGLRVQKILSEVMKPYKEQVKRGTLSEDKDRRLTLTAFVRGCLVDWKGLEDNGKNLKYTEQAAIDLLVDLPDLANDLLAYSQDMANYQDLEEVGND